MTPWRWFTKYDIVLPVSADRNLQKHIRELDRKRREFRRDENVGAEARVTDEMASICFHEELLDQALQLWKEALRIYQASNDRISMSEIYSKIGNTYRKRSNPKEAAKFYQKALVIDREHHQGENALISLHNLASVWLESGNYTNATETLADALETARNHQLDEWEAYTLYRQGLAYRRLFRYVEAYQIFDSALKTAENLHITDLMILNMIGLGDLYNDIGEYSQALKCYNNAVTGSQNVKEKTLHAESLTRLAALKLHIGALDEAREITRNVDSLVSDSKPNNMRIELDLLRSEIYYSRGMKENSNRLIESILQMSADLSCIPGIVRAKIQLAGMEIDRSRFQNALDILQGLDKDGIKPGDIFIEIEQMLALGRVYCGLNRLEDAFTVLEHAVVKAEKTRIPRYLWAAHYGLARVFDLQQQHQHAKVEYERADTIVQQVVLTLDNPSRKQFIEHRERQLLYQHFILLLIKLAHKEQAVRILNRVDSPGLQRRLGHLLEE